MRTIFHGCKQRVVVVLGRIGRDVRFNIKTLVAITVLIAAATGICQLQITSAFIALAMLFTVLVFADDIWPWLPK